MAQSTATYTTKQLAQKYRVTTQTMNRWIRKTCKAEAIDVSDFGSVDPKDARIRIFSSEDIELIEKHIPEQDVSSEQPIAPTAVIDRENTITHVDRDSRGLFDFSAMTPIQVNVTHINFGELNQQTAEFNQTRVSGLSAIGQLLEVDLMNSVAQAIAQNRHAVSGFSAQAVNNVANRVAGGENAKPF